MDASGGSVNGNDYFSLAPSEGNGSRYRQLRPAPTTGHSQASQSNASASNTTLGQHLGPLPQDYNSIGPVIASFGGGSQLGQDTNTYVAWSSQRRVAIISALVTGLLQQYSTILASIPSPGDNPLLQPQAGLVDQHPLSRTPGSFLTIVIPIHHHPAPASAPAPTPAKREQQVDAVSELACSENERFICPRPDGKQFISTSPAEVIDYLIRNHDFERVPYKGGGNRKAANYIAKRETANAPWCALCTWCYKAFDTKEKLSEHSQYHRDNQVKLNGFHKSEKLNIIRNLLHLRPNPCNSHRHEQNAAGAQDASPGPDLQQRQAVGPVDLSVDGITVPEHTDPEGALSPALTDFLYMGANFNAESEMEGIVDGADHQQHGDWVNLRVLHVNPQVLQLNGPQKQI